MSIATRVQNHFGRMLKQYRWNEFREPTSIREVAKEIGISAATLSRLENGYPPDFNTWMKIQNWMFKP